MIVMALCVVALLGIVVGFAIAVVWAQDLQRDQIVGNREEALLCLFAISWYAGTIRGAVLDRPVMLWRSEFHRRRLQAAERIEARLCEQFKLGELDKLVVGPAESRGYDDNTDNLWS